jgi:hypothetical protein
MLPAEQRTSRTQKRSLYLTSLLLQVLTNIYSGRIFAKAKRTFWGRLNLSGKGPLLEIGGPLFLLKGIVGEPRPYTTQVLHTTGSPRFYTLLSIQRVESFAET